MNSQITPGGMSRVHSAEFWRELGELGSFVLTEGVRAAAGKLDTASLLEALNAGVLDGTRDSEERIKAVYQASLDFGGPLLPVLDKWLAVHRQAVDNHALSENEQSRYQNYAAGVLYDLAESKNANAPDIIRIYRRHGADPFWEEPNFNTYKSAAADRAFGAGRPDLLAAMLHGLHFTENNPLPELKRADDKTLLHRASKLGTIDVRMYRACLQVIGEHIGPEYRQPYHDLYDATVNSLLSTTRSVGVPTWDRISNVAEVLIAGARPDEPSKWLNLTKVILDGKVCFPVEVLNNPKASEPEEVFDVLLSESGLDPNLEYGGGRLLHCAARCNYARVVERLLEAGADHMAVTTTYNEAGDDVSKTARMLALESDFPEVVRVIDAFVAKSAISAVLARRPAP